MTTHQGQPVDVRDNIPKAPTETWRTEAAAKIQKHHWDKIQEEAEQAGDYLGYLRTAAMKEQHGRADTCARRVRAAINEIMDRLERLDAIREMRDIYETVTEEKPS